MEKEMKTLSEMMQKFRDKHFIHDFEIKDKLLTCKETDESFKEEDLIVDRTYRYEGDSNPDDMCILYAITANSGTQGILLDAYGTYANPQISEFIKNVPVREISEKQVTE